MENGDRCLDGSVCIEWWSCLQDGWCCPFACDTCTFYFGRDNG